MTTLTLAGGAGVVMGAALDLSDRLLILTQRGSYAAAYLLRLTPSGTLDPAFPVRDVYADFPVGLATARRAQGLAVQANGYAVVSYTVNVTGLADVALVRYTDAGSPDSGFGSGGFTRTGLTQGLTARGLAIEPDGSLLVASHVTVTTAPAWSATVFRFFASGALDASYGTGGMASPIGSASPGTGPTINDLELAPNGRAFLVCTGVPDVRILVAYLGN